MVWGRIGVTDDDRPVVIQLEDATFSALKKRQRVEEKDSNEVIYYEPSNSS